MTIILDWLKWIEMESFIKTIFMYFLGFLFLTVIEKGFREDRNVYKYIIFITSSSTNSLSLKFVQMDFKILAFNKFTNSKIKLFDNVSRYNHR